MPNVHILPLHGEIDVSRKDATEKELRLLEGLQAAFVIIDLSDVSYIDATFLNLLLQLQKRLSQRSDETMITIVAGAASNVSRVLRVTGLDTHFPVFNDISSARTAADRRLAGPELPKRSA